MSRYPAMLLFLRRQSLTDNELSEPHKHRTSDLDGRESRNRAMDGELQAVRTLIMGGSLSKLKVTTMQQKKHA